jgi:hypothetical protein
MPTLQHEALKAIAGSQEEAFAFCEVHGIYYHPMEPTYLTMGRIAQWALLMKNVEVPHIATTGGITTLEIRSGQQGTPMSEGGQA